ncbi:tri14-like protein [Purpureocillium lavendulum]|uniref:Tri14-like protein n=1 Tax=Purpureocillium lavendulum TaxID=1247861 RepID=A0AB34FJQ6_9HYPO|nr:tri14-like protein [Purpureocillium lavendulum]
MSSSFVKVALLSAAGALAGPLASRADAPGASCASPSGDLTISSLKLYPENADFDTKRCVSYLSVLYNSSVAVYDAAKNKVQDIIEFPELTGNPKLHASGVKMGPAGQLFVVVNAGAAFDTEGKDISGDNFLVSYDLDTKKVLYKADLNKAHNGEFGGFQDIAHDQCGNSFVVGSYPASIVRVSADGSKVDLWAGDKGAKSTSFGYSGIVSHRNTLIVSNGGDDKLYRVDARKQAEPTAIPLEGNKTVGTQNSMDKIYMPSKYEGKVILVSDNVKGTIVVRSDNDWESAKVLCAIPNPYQKENGFSVGTVQIGQRIRVIIQYFEGNNGTRSDFPLVDVTDEVDKCVKQEVPARA